MEKQKEVLNSINESFSDLANPYRIEAGRNVGENALLDIARTVDREYVWVFDEETSTWYYYPSNFSVEFDYDRGTSRYTATIPKELVNPPGTLADLYHIHPDSIVSKLLEKKRGQHSEEFLRVSNQIPKKDDLEAASKLVPNGYTSFKIVTSAGITTLRYCPEKLDKKQERHSLPEITISSEMIYEALKEGFAPAVHKVFEQLNKHYDGVFVFEFRPHSS